MYYIYGQSGPSLLIESTDSMIYGSHWVEKKHHMEVKIELNTVIVTVRLLLHRSRCSIYVHAMVYIDCQTPHFGRSGQLIFATSANNGVKRSRRRAFGILRRLFVA